MRPHLDPEQFPLDEWALVESRFDPTLMGRTETLFNVANGYLGLRGNLDEGREAVEAGTYVNGLHETWPIQHAEEAYGFSRIGQTLVNAPDAKVIRLYVDDEPLLLSNAEVTEYERRLDFRDGALTRDFVWRTPGGKHVRIRTSRLVSFADRHLALMEYEVEVLDADASIVFSSQLLNRQDGTDEYRSSFHGIEAGQAEPITGSSGMGDGRGDPRRAESLRGRVLQPVISGVEGDRLMLAYRVTNSGMSIAVGVDHQLTVDGVAMACATQQTEGPVRADSRAEDDLAKRVFRIEARAGQRIRLTKFASYHTAAVAPPRELADRCDRTLDRALDTPVSVHRSRQRAWLDAFWTTSDVRVPGQPELQQAVRWNLFQLAQAAGRADGAGIAAKGVSGSGYGGHYFWDTEIFVLPFLTYTQPGMARNALRFRCSLLDAARRRARVLNENGALFPWRTINGEESSAFYAASTAQYHIDADIAHAIAQYVAATGDTEFLRREGIDVLVETARLWADLGFWRTNGAGSFHIHGVTGPDEYTTVVNDNLFTNVMAQENLEVAARAVEWLREHAPDDFHTMSVRLGLAEQEVREWRRAAGGMHIPYDDTIGVHPQDDSFLSKEVWDLERTPREQRPLLLHFHPLVIYRFQVIKQADVVLALFLRGDRFSAEEKLRDFEYYEPLTTGDSSLSAVVQSVIASEVGHARLAQRYLRESAFLDLADLHGNTDVGVHIASAGGLWSALVGGVGGMRDHGGRVSFDPRLPEEWEGLEFSLLVLGSRIAVRLVREAIEFELAAGAPVEVDVRGETVRIEATPVRVPLADQGTRRTNRPSLAEIRGTHRGDGSLVTASVPLTTGPIDVAGR